VVNSAHPDIYTYVPLAAFVPRLAPSQNDVDPQAILIRGDDARVADMKAKRAIHVELIKGETPVPAAAAATTTTASALSGEQAADVIGSVLPLLSLPDPTPAFQAGMALLFTEQEMTAEGIEILVNAAGTQGVGLQRLTNEELDQMPQEVPRPRGAADVRRVFSLFTHNFFFFSTFG
jgi:hypothetical protein